MLYFTIWWYHIIPYHIIPYHIIPYQLVFDQPYNIVWYTWHMLYYIADVTLHRITSSIVLFSVMFVLQHRKLCHTVSHHIILHMLCTYHMYTIESYRIYPSGLWNQLESGRFALRSKFAAGTSPAQPSWAQQFETKGVCSSRGLTYWLLDCRVCGLFICFEWMIARLMHEGSIGWLIGWLADWLIVAESTTLTPHKIMATSDSAVLCSLENNPVFNGRLPSLFFRAFDYLIAERHSLDWWFPTQIVSTLFPHSFRSPA